MNVRGSWGQFAEWWKKEKKFEVSAEMRRSGCEDAMTMSNEWPNELHFWECKIRFSSQECEVAPSSISRSPQSSFVSWGDLFMCIISSLFWTKVQRQLKSNQGKDLNWLQNCLTRAYRRVFEALWHKNDCIKMAQFYSEKLAAAQHAFT